MPDQSEPAGEPRTTIDHLPPPAETVSYVLAAADTVDQIESIRATSPTGPGTVVPLAGAPVIPGYVIEAKIAEGGMGRVYAGRDVTLDREVAIKTLLAGANAERFVVEARITARLPHPGIPPVYALGTLTDGVPYLAMKLIRGRTLAELLKERASPQANLSRFLQIFEQIAQAVGFAHSQGVIHRDLKPLNVMVGAFGEVQVMDWGLAKEVGQSEPTSMSRAENHGSDQHQTRAGAILGTPGYMAPEQARGEPADSRADVFALGSILATILTGGSAFAGMTPKEIVAKAAAGDLSAVTQRLETCGADLELINLAKRCLSADAKNRPADAHAVAAAVGAYRAGVEARLRQAETDKATAETRAMETRKRQRALTWAGGVIAAVLLAGIVGTSIGAVEAWKQTGIARRQETEAKKQETIAKAETAKKIEALVAETAAKEDARKKLEFSKKTYGILKSFFSALDPRKKSQTLGELRTALTSNLQQAVKELEGSAIGEPVDVAEMQLILGNALNGLGEAAMAVELLEKAVATQTEQLGPDHLETLTSQNNLAKCYEDAGKFDRAMPLYEETPRRLQAKFGPDHPLTLTSMANLAGVYRDNGKPEQALTMFEEILKLQKAKLGADHETTLVCMSNIAHTYRKLGQHDNAIRLYEEAVELMKASLGPDHPDTLATIHGLAAAYNAAGQHYKAVPLCEETLKLTKAKLGPEHPDTLKSMFGQARAYQDVSRLNDAIPVYEECLRLEKVKLGPDHPDTLRCMAHLAQSYHAARKPDQALPLLEETLRLRKATIGPDHPDTLKSMNDLATGYFVARKLSLVLPLLEEAHQLQKAKLGLDHRDTLQSMNNLAVGYQANGKWDQALPLFEEVIRLRSKNLGPDHFETLASMDNLAKSYDAVGQRDKALPLYEEILKRTKAKLGPDDDSTIACLANLGKAYCAAKEGVKAALVMKELVAAQRQLATKDDPRLALLLAQMSQDLLKCDQFATAEEMLRESFAIREKVEPDAWTTFETQSLLGRALLGQQKYTDAEPLLLQGYGGMKAREKSIPPAAIARLPKAIDPLIELYSATENPGEVNKWQAERAKYFAATGTK